MMIAAMIVLHHAAMTIISAIIMMTMISIARSYSRPEAYAYDDFTIKSNRIN